VKAGARAAGLFERGPQVVAAHAAIGQHLEQRVGVVSDVGPGDGVIVHQNARDAVAVAHEQLALPGGDGLFEAGVDLA
jgi:hypothetical protein